MGVDDVRCLHNIHIISFALFILHKKGQKEYGHHVNSHIISLRPSGL